MKMYFSGTPGESYGAPEEVVDRPDVMLTFFDFHDKKGSHPSAKRFYTELEAREKHENHRERKTT